MTLEPNARVDLAMAHEMLSKAVHEIAGRMRSDKANEFVEGWWTDHRGELLMTSHDAIPPYLNEDTYAMYVLREEAEDLQSPVLVRRMSAAVLKRLRRKMGSSAHPWYGCTLESEPSPDGPDFDVYLAVPAAPVD